MTRAELAALLSTAFHYTAPADAASRYTDISNLPQLEAIEAVTDAGWMRGIGNNQFDPETPVTRVALAVIMGTWLKQAHPYSSSAPSPMGYSDVSAQHWAYNAIVSVQPLNTLPVSTDKFTTSFHDID